MESIQEVTEELIVEQKTKRNNRTKKFSSEPTETTPPGSPRQSIPERKTLRQLIRKHVKRLPRPSGDAETESEFLQRQSADILDQQAAGGLGLTGRGGHGKHEIQQVFEKLVARYKSADLLSAQHTEKVLEADFDEQEQELIYQSLLSGQVSSQVSSQVPLPNQIKQRVYQAVSRIRNRKRVGRSHRSHATTDTVRFCRIFYRSPLVRPAIKYEPVTKRTSTSLLTAARAALAKAKCARKLEVVKQDRGYCTPQNVPYREFGAVRSDPRDMLVDQLQSTLPQVAQRHYRTEREKEKERWQPPTRPDRAQAKGQCRPNVNMLKDNAFYINSGLTQIRSQLREGNRRINAVRNGRKYEQHWRESHERRMKEQEQINKKLADTSTEMSVHDPVETTLEHLTPQPEKRSAAVVRTASKFLKKYTAELNSHLKKSAKCFQLNTTEQGQRRLAGKRVELFLDKLKYIHTLLCMLKNLRGQHCKLRHLPMSLVWELRSDPLRTKHSLGKKAVSGSRRNLAGLDAVSSVSRILATPTKSGLSLVKGGGGYQSPGSSTTSLLNSPSASRLVTASLSQNLQRIKYSSAAPYLETWEDFLAVNPRDRRGRRANKLMSADRVGSRPASQTSNQLLSHRQATAPAAATKAVVYKASPARKMMWQLVRRTFLTGYSAERMIKSLVDEAQVDEAVSRREGYDALTRVKIGWLKSKISSTGKVQKKLDHIYRNSIKCYNMKKGRRIREEGLNAWRWRARRSLAFPLFDKIQTERVQLHDKQDVWYELAVGVYGSATIPGAAMLVTESESYCGSYSDEEWRTASKLLAALSRFSDEMLLGAVVNCEEKMRLLALSVPAYEILTLGMQVAFQFVLGNVLMIDPEMLHVWMSERSLPIHAGLGHELVVPQFRLQEIKAEKEAVNREINNILNDGASKS